MGDRHSDGGASARPRAGARGPVPPADSGTGPAGPESALGTALRADALRPPAEQQAVAAFRAARDAGMHQGARTRRQDDWRPRRTRARRSVRAALTAFLASLTLGGAAIAIGLPGSAGTAHDDGPGPARPSRTASGTPAAAPDGATAPAPVTAPSRGRPATAKDIQAHCRAYASVKGRGEALDSAAWRRFLAAAGGEDGVADYCARQSPGIGAADAGRAGGKPNGAAGGRQPGRSEHPNRGRQQPPG